MNVKNKKGLLFQKKYIHICWSCGRKFFTADWQKHDCKKKEE